MKDPSKYWESCCTKGILTNLSLFQHYIFDETNFCKNLFCVNSDQAETFQVVRDSVPQLRLHIYMTPNDRQSYKCDWKKIHLYLSLKSTSIYNWNVGNHITLHFILFLSLTWKQKNSVLWDCDKWKDLDILHDKSNAILYREEAELQIWSWLQQIKRKLNPQSWYSALHGDAGLYW